MFYNQLKTGLLLASLSALLLLMGNLVAGTTGLYCALLMALVMNGITYFFCEKIVLTLYKAEPLDQTEYDWIHNIVKELTTTMNLPMPKLWIIKTSMANAFATGRNPNHASVAVTTGILEILDHTELRGVLAHELSHIKNRDILISSVAATIATSIGYLANFLQHTAFWSNRQNYKHRNNNPIALLFVAILMPIAATLVQLAISRSREYLADETGATCCQDPLALASALEKLQGHIPKAHMKNNDTTHASTASLFIVHPFSGNSLGRLFSTHPPIEERVARLRQLYLKLF